MRAEDLALFKTHEAKGHGLQYHAWATLGRTSVRYSEIRVKILQILRAETEN